jgi:exopolysaccharide biosynthesis polyprenyl glycosylphosphotransferase
MENRLEFWSAISDTCILSNIFAFGIYGMMPVNVAPIKPNEKNRSPVALGRRAEFSIQLNQIIDAILLVLSLWLAYILRYELGHIFKSILPVESVNAFVWLVVLIIPFGPRLLELQGFYEYPLQKTIVKSLRQVVPALLWLTILICGCAIFFRLSLNSRSVILLFGLVGTVTLVIKERIVVLYLRGRVARGDHRERVIVAGSSEEISDLLERFRFDQWSEIEIVKTIDIAVEPISELVRSLHEYSVGRVIFAAGRTELGRVQEAIAACELEGVEAWLIADFVRTSIARAGFDMFGSQPMLVFRSTPNLSWELVSKRTIDFVGALIGLTLLAPFMLVVAVVIKMTSPGPAIFSQMRCGRHGEPFRMFKFRSMYTDAEQRRQELDVFNQMSGPVFKLDDDPRVTPFGRWLRKFSVDELPQLFNVLGGQMSLVGPRPLPTYEVESFSNPAQRRRLSVKPGITCLWQIGGRNEVRDFQAWVKLDLEYIDNWSIWLDMRILFRTIPAVLLGHGAK